MAVSRVLSIEITDMVTHICDIGYNKKNPVVYKSVIFDNPQYTVEDGFVLDRAPYRAALKRELDTAHIRTKDVVFVLSSSKVINREVTVPDMKPELVEGLIENERSEYFPMDTSDHQFAYEVLEKIKESKQQRISIYAVPELLLKNIKTLANELSLNVVAIDYAGNSVYQWLKRNTAVNIEMYLQINEKNSSFTILDKKMLELQRNMNFGVQTLVNTMNDMPGNAEDLEFADGLVKLSGEKLLFSSFTEADEIVPENDEERAALALKARLTDAVRPLIGNLTSVLEYYNTKKRGALMRGGAGAPQQQQPQAPQAPQAPAGEGGETHEEPLARIYLGGVGSFVQGFKEIIENEFNGIEVVILKELPGANIHKHNNVAKSHGSELIACMGAANTSINFMRKSEKEKLSKTLIASAFGLVLVIGAAVLIILNGKAEYDKEMTRREVLLAKQAEAESTGIEDLEAAYGAEQAYLYEIIDADKSTFNHNENWNDIMGYLESESVSDIIISSFSSDNTGISMGVTVSSKEEAAKLLLQFKQIPYFSDVAITGISEGGGEDEVSKSVSFSLRCTYKLPGEEAEEEAPVAEAEEE